MKAVAKVLGVRIRKIIIVVTPTPTLLLSVGVAEALGTVLGIMVYGADTPVPSTSSWQ